MLVTKMSSPTSWIFEPRASVIIFQPSQSSSAMPSSMEMIGILLDPFGPELHHLFGRALALVGFLEDILAAGLVIELAGGGIERDADLRAWLVTGLGDGFEHHFESLLVGFEVGRETAFVADRGGVAALFEHAFQGVEHFGAHAQGFGEFRRAVGTTMNS